VTANVLPRPTVGQASDLQDLLLVDGEKLDKCPKDGGGELGPRVDRTPDDQAGNFVIVNEDAKLRGLAGDGDAADGKGVM
jgi:hypothetical protein